MSDKYPASCIPEGMFLIPEDFPHDDDNYEAMSRILERIEGLSELLYDAGTAYRNGSDVSTNAIQQTAETIHGLSDQAKQVIDHIFKVNGGKLS